MRNKKGFTLVEMLIVIVIIGILAATILPKLMGAQDRARDTGRKADLNQLHSAMQLYKIDNMSYFTASTTIVGCNTLDKTKSTTAVTDTNKDTYLKSLIETVSSENNLQKYLSSVPVKDPAGEYYRICKLDKGYIIWSNTETKAWGNVAFGSNGVDWMTNGSSDNTLKTNPLASQASDTDSHYVVFANS